jgi:hypothetical protein
MQWLGAELLGYANSRELNDRVVKVFPCSAVCGAIHSLQRRNNSLFRGVGNFSSKVLIYSIFSASDSVNPAVTLVFPCTFPVSREVTVGDQFRRTASATRQSAQVDVISQGRK